MEALERQAFEQFTESTQTEIDTATPGGDALAGDVPEVHDERLEGAALDTSAPCRTCRTSGPAWLDGAAPAMPLERAARTCCA